MRPGRRRRRAGGRPAGAVCVATRGGVPVQLCPQLVDDGRRLIAVRVGPPRVARRAAPGSSSRASMAAARSSKRATMSRSREWARATASGGIDCARPQFVDPQRQPVGRGGRHGHELGGTVGARARPAVGGLGPTDARRGGDAGQHLAHIGERGGRIPLCPTTPARPSPPRRESVPPMRRSVRSASSEQAAAASVGVGVRVGHAHPYAVAPTPGPRRAPRWLAPPRRSRRRALRGSGRPPAP